MCVCGTWGSLEETRPAQVWEPRIQGREAPADTPSICSPGHSAAPGGWGDSCLQVYSCPGAHSPSHQLARRAEHIRTLNCRETEALNTGLAKSRVGASSWEPGDGLSCARSGTRPQGPQGCPTFTVWLPPLLRVCVLRGRHAGRPGSRTAWGHGPTSPGEQNILTWGPWRQQRKMVCGLLIQKDQEWPEQMGESQGRGDTDSWGPPHQKETCSSTPQAESAMRLCRTQRKTEIKLFK